MADEEDEREEELGSLTAIYPELVLEHDFTATLSIPVAPAAPLLVRFVPPTNTDPSYALALSKSHVERDVRLSHLPPLDLHVTLPKDYPASAPPIVRLTAQQDWLPKEKILELEAEAAKLWEEYGSCQILFVYIDHLQQAAERGFDLSDSTEGCLVLPETKEAELKSYDTKTRLAIFNAGTYDCGVCLEPRKGSACYKMERCGHVFCKQCLQDFYNNAIKEGDVAVMRCLDPGCGKDKRKSKKKSERTLHPRELLAMGVEEEKVRRYVEMKRKKKLEADKTTVYCPRTWCQGPARSEKYPVIPTDLYSYVDDLSDAESEGDGVKKEPIEAPKVNTTNSQPDPVARLVVCEKCEYAFCKVCFATWHGDYVRCYPRDPNELSVEEKATYEYIRLHTSPCPYCTAPVQKTMGCNHMNCFNCRTHFCYLCGRWLDADNPYQHFNTGGSPCFQRLWELEEGDEGQGPEDGRGFAGGARGWEQMAIDAAREAEAQEAAAAGAPVGPVLRAAEPIVPQQDPIIVQLAQLGIEIDDDELADLNEIQAQNGGHLNIAQIIAHDNRPVPPPPPAPAQRGGRRQRNRFPRAPPPANGPGQAQAVRAHERRQPRPALAADENVQGRDGNVRVRDGRGDVRGGVRQDRQQEELQRFLELAQQDQEEDWDSDGIGEDDEDFEIR